MIINNGFEVLNSRFPHYLTNKLKSRMVQSLNEQNVVLNKLYDLCFSVQVTGKSTLLSFQTEFMISKPFVNLQSERIQLCFMVKV